MVTPLQKLKQNQTNKKLQGITTPLWKGDNFHDVIGLRIS